MTPVKRRTQLKLIAGLLLSAVSGLSACKINKADDNTDKAGAPTASAAKTGDKKPVIALTLMTYNNPFFAVIKSVARKTAEAKGFQFREHDSQFDSNKQAAAIEDFLAQGVDAILLNPVDSSAIVKSVEKANQKGVPVITIDVNADGGKLATFVASDNYKLGVLTGEYIAKRLDGKGKVAMLTHPTVSSGLNREQGAKSVLKNYPGIQIVAEQATRGERLVSVDVAENVLTANKHLDCIWAINDPTALGAIQAVKQAKREKELFVVAVDGSPEAVEAIKLGGAFAASAAQYPQRMAAAAVEQAVLAMKGEKLKEFFPIEGSLITKDNLASYPGWSE
jgi:ribose transport system substrate-binding protein